MKRTLPYLRIAVVLGSWLVAMPAMADIFVIAHPNNPQKTLSREQVINLYLGRSRTFSSNEIAVVLDQQDSNPIRERFFKKLAGMSLSQINAHWATLTFTGRLIPPLGVIGDDAMLEWVRNTPSAIGYVETQPTDGSVQVVFRIQE